MNYVFDKETQNCINSKIDEDKQNDNVQEDVKKKPKQVNGWFGFLLYLPYNFKTLKLIKKVFFSCKIISTLMFFKTLYAVI